MRIAICDDDKICAEQIKKEVELLLSEKKLRPEFDLYFESEDLFNCEICYDIAFLDIEMKPYSGIEVAQKLKDSNPYITIFIITAYDKYLDDAMDLNVFRYIKKPLDLKRLRSGLFKALESIDNNVITFFLKQGSASENILSNDIQYVETVGRHTKVVTINGEYISDNKLDFWKDKLSASFFYKVHKSYIINMKHITNYKRDCVVLSEKHSIPIAYRKQAEFRSYFLSYFGGR